MVSSSIFICVLKFPKCKRNRIYNTADISSSLSLNTSPYLNATKTQSKKKIDSIYGNAIYICHVHTFCVNKIKQNCHATNKRNKNKNM